MITKILISSQRNVPVLLRRILLALVLGELQRPMLNGITNASQRGQVSTCLFFDVGNDTES